MSAVILAQARAMKQDYLLTGKIVVQYSSDQNTIAPVGIEFKENSAINLLSITNFHLITCTPLQKAMVA